jgi:hypothetical protein
MDDISGLASDLEALLQGGLGEDDFRRKYEPRIPLPILEAIWSNLEHYLADADLRAKDAAYRAMQTAEMQKLIRLLRENAPLSRLRRVNFLWPA